MTAYLDVKPITYQKNQTSSYVLVCSPPPPLSPSGGALLQDSHRRWGTCRVWSEVVENFDQQQLRSHQGYAIRGSGVYARPKVGGGGICVACCLQKDQTHPQCNLQVVTDFFDELKSRSQGYASMEYQITGYRKNDLVRLDIRINNEPAEPLACIVHREAAYRTGR